MWELCLFLCGGGALISTGSYLTHVVRNKYTESPKTKFKKLTKLLDIKNSPNCINCYNVITEDLTEIRRKRSLPSTLCQFCQAKLDQDQERANKYKLERDLKEETERLATYYTKRAEEEFKIANAPITSSGMITISVPYQSTFVDQLTNRLNQKYPHARVKFKYANGWGDEVMSLRSMYSHDYSMNMNWLNNVGAKIYTKLNLYVDKSSQHPVQMEEEIFQQACELIDKSDHLP